MIPSVQQRVVRVVIRMGGTSGDAAKALGLTKRHCTRIARKMGMSFRYPFAHTVAAKARDYLSRGEA